MIRSNTLNHKDHTVPISNIITIRDKKLSKSKVLKIEESINQVIETKKEFSNEILDFTTEQTISCLRQFGIFQDPGRVTQKDVILLEQSIQSLIYRYYGILHPIHDIVDQLISTDDDSEEIEEME